MPSLWQQLLQPHVLAASWLAVAAFLLTAFNGEVPEPYMDEIFHVPQAQRYCRGDFAHWDPKITTPPGLYLLAAAYVRATEAARSALAALSGLSLPSNADACGIGVLRSFNAASAAVCAALFHAAYRRLHPEAGSRFALAMAATMSMLPLHFFFSFLFYTDVLSTALVTASYLAVLHENATAAAVLSLASIGVRQTNAVWAGFCLGIGVIRHVDASVPCTSRGRPLPSQVVELLTTVWELKWRLLRKFWGLVLVQLLFVAFLQHNGGVVLGDRSNHVSVFHPTQLLYLALYTAAASWAVHFRPQRAASALAGAWQRLRRDPLLTAVSLALAAVVPVACVRFFTLVHPFVLADNRHYTFYIWRKILGRHPLVRYAMVGPYVYSAHSVTASLSSRQPALFILLFYTCCAATLVPAWLVELRYFTIPTVFVLLHMEPPSERQLAACAASFLAVNIASFWLFLRYPYTWGDGSVARFMW